MIDKFMLFLFGSSSLGGVIAQVTSHEPGTVNMQYLMVSAVGALGCAIIYLHKQNIKRADKDKQEYDDKVTDLIERLDKKESAMSVERIARIDMLMKRISDDTEAKKDVAHAIQNNTTAVKDLRTLIENLERLIEESMKK
jgi:hypothetical protein